MSKKQLPVAPAGRPCARVTCETLPSALDRWDGGIKGKRRLSTVWQILKFLRG